VRATCKGNLKWSSSWRATLPGSAAMFLRRSVHAACACWSADRLLPARCRFTLSSRLEADPGITIEYGAEVSALHGADRSRRALSIRDVKTGATRVIDTCAPVHHGGRGAEQHAWLAGLVKLDNKGFVITVPAQTPRPRPSPPRSRVCLRSVMSAQARSSALPPRSAKGSVVISKVWEFVNRS